MYGYRLLSRFSHFLFFFARPKIISAGFDETSLIDVKFMLMGARAGYTRGWQLSLLVYVYGAPH